MIQRRGPGKEKRRGSLSKKVGGLDSETGHPLPAFIAEHELDALPPEVRPYVTVSSLNTFGFQSLPSP
jgi:hypothetical protein